MTKQKTYSEMFHASICKGISIGVLQFLKVNRVKPTNSQIAKFCVILTSEGIKDVEYPFKASFVANLQAAANEENKEFVELYNQRKLKRMRAKIETLGAAIVLKFLDDERPQALKTLHAIAIE